MEHTTPTNTAAFIAETEAFIAAAEATDARIEALLATGSTAARLADLALQLEMGRRELDAQERYQLRITRAMRAG